MLTPASSATNSVSLTSSLTTVTTQTANPQNTAVVKATEEMAQIFIDSVNNSIRPEKYLTVTNTVIWVKFLGVYGFYGKLPGIKVAAKAINQPIVKNAVLAGITFLEYLPYALRWFSPLYDSSATRPKDEAHKNDYFENYVRQLRNALPEALRFENTLYDASGKKYDKKCTTIETKLGGRKIGNIICDEKGLPLFNGDGSLRINLCATEVGDWSCATASLAVPATYYLFMEFFYKGLVTYSASKDLTTSAVFFFRKWQDDVIREMTEKNRIPDDQLIQSVKEDKSLICPLSGRVTVIPMLCPTEQAKNSEQQQNMEYEKIKLYLLVHDCCYLHPAEKLHPDQLKFNSVAWIKIQNGRIKVEKSTSVNTTTSKPNNDSSENKANNLSQSLTAASDKIGQAWKKSTL